MKNIMIAGSWDETNEKLLSMAFNLGYTLSKNGYIIFTGGGSGIPYEVNRGVREANGFNISFVNEGRCSDKESDYIKSSKINIFTEMGWDGRSVLAVKSCDVLLVLGGSNGTLNEITLAYLNKIPVYILRNSSDMINRLEKFLFRGKFIDLRENVELVFFDSIEEILKIINNTLVG